MTAAALIPANPVPSPAPIPAINQTINFVSINGPPQNNDEYYNLSVQKDGSKSEGLQKKNPQAAADQKFFAHFVHQRLTFPEFCNHEILSP